MLSEFKMNFIVWIKLRFERINIWMESKVFTQAQKNDELKHKLTRQQHDLMQTRENYDTKTIGVALDTRTIERELHALLEKHTEVTRVETEVSPVVSLNMPALHKRNYEEEHYGGRGNRHIFSIRSTDTNYSKTKLVVPGLLYNVILCHLADSDSPTIVFSDIKGLYIMTKDGENTRVNWGDLESVSGAHHTPHELSRKLSLNTAEPVIRNVTRGIGAMNELFIVVNASYSDRLSDDSILYSTTYNSN